MKNRLPLILTLVTGAGLFFWLRRKKAAGMNLRYEPIDIAIDSQRSAASLFSRIYYNLKLRLINNESANVNIRAINLQAFLNVADRQPRKIGDIVNNTGFQVPAKGQKEIKLDTSISTGGVIQIIKDLLLEGINFQINVNGFVDTDLGRLDINFTKDFGTGGISAPIPYTYKNFSYLATYSNKKDLLSDVKKLGKNKKEYKIVEYLSPVKRSIKSLFSKNKPTQQKMFVLYVK
jgi:hypothetical protein